jgi:ligand-binding sensor domain-containing protein
MYIPGEGLVGYNSANGIKNEAVDKYPYVSYQDDKGNVWINYGKNYFLYDPKTEKFSLGELSQEEKEMCKFSQTWTYQRSKLHKLSNKELSLIASELKKELKFENLQVINSVCKDRQGIFWIGTYGKGLYRYDPKTKSFTVLTEKDGLPNSVVYGILLDKEGYLWLSTNLGIAKFDPRTQTFRSYTATDGLQSNEFNAGAYFQSKSGEMFFAGVNGLNRFYPEQIKENTLIPPVVITSFKVHEKETPESRKAMSESLYNKQNAFIELSYLENFISFDFASLNFNHPEKNLYSYKLEGLEGKWSIPNLRRYASYTILPPGDYVFRVKASNNDGVWNEVGASIRVKILPPPWKTWWAYLLYFLGFVSISVAFYRSRIRKIEEQTKLT